jgi:Pentapeptide repeats (8 copies)
MDDAWKSAPLRRDEALTRQPLGRPDEHVRFSFRHFDGSEMKPTPPAAAAGRRRSRGLRKLSSENISKATEETAAQVTRIGLTFFATTAFCFLSLFSPDSALLAGSEKINVPFGGPVSFSGFMLLGPAILIVLRVYLQIYFEHSERLDRLARSMSVVRTSPTLIPLQNRLIRYFGALIFYLLLPLILLFFAWKAAALPAWGAGLLCVAAGVITSHVMLPLKTFSRRAKALTAGAAIAGSGLLVVAGMIGGFEPVRRPFQLGHTNLSGQWLVEDDLRGANLDSADLRNSNLIGANLSGADLSVADLRDANLSSAKLSSAKLRGASLRGANLNRANLSKANLLGARLNGAFLFGANLLGANLFGADLTGADLSDARLSDANLMAADLSDAVNLTQGQLDTACGDAETKLPEGFKLKDCE